MIDIKTVNRALELINESPRQNRTLLIPDRDALTKIHSRISELLAQDMRPYIVRPVEEDTFEKAHSRFVDRIIIGALKDIPVPLYPPLPLQTLDVKGEVE